MHNNSFAWWTSLYGVISFIALSFLISPPHLEYLLIYIIVGLVASYALHLNKINNDRQKANKSTLLFVITLTALLTNLFFERWVYSSKLANIASLIEMEPPVLVALLSVCIGLVALDAILQIIIYLECKLDHYPICINNVVIIILSLIQFLQLQYSSLQSFDLSFSVETVKLLTSLCLLFVINNIFALIISKKYCLLFACFFITGWSIANYYVIKFHGSPLYFSEFSSFKTALAVIGAYRFSITPTIFILVLFCILACCTLRILPLGINRNNQKQYYLFLLALLFSAIGLKNQLERAGAGWSWRDNIINDGFVLSFARDMNVNAESIVKPNSYNQDNLVYEEPGGLEIKDYSDVIIILNETFCNLSNYTDIETDKDCWKGFYEIKNAIIGNAIVPGIGGGTNLSEFELMTSKSTNLLPNAAPYLFLSPEILSRSHIDYFNSLGYFTVGMHCGTNTNYSRNTVYPSMGYDEIYLGESDFKYQSKNGSRNWLDSDNYHDLIERYENIQNELPKFIYQLTLQNHGGWEQNDDQLDTIHVLGDFGDLTDDLNEYYSSIQLSCEAFIELTEYFSKVDRKVVICMVGDHAPSFISSLENKSEFPDELAQRVVPYIIWSNKEMKTDLYTEYTSVTDLIPMLINIAGLPNTAFTQTINKLHEQFPVRLKNGMIMTKTGNLEMFDETNTEYDIISQYYCLEYNSLCTGEEYIKELFWPRVK